MNGGEWTCVWWSRGGTAGLGTSFTSVVKQLFACSCVNLSLVDLVPFSKFLSPSK